MSAEPPMHPSLIDLICAERIIDPLHKSEFQNGINWMIDRAIILDARLRQHYGKAMIEKVQDWGNDNGNVFIHSEAADLVNRLFPSEISVMPGEGQSVDRSTGESTPAPGTPAHQPIGMFGMQDKTLADVPMQQLTQQAVDEWDDAALVLTIRNAIKAHLDRSCLDFHGAAGKAFDVMRPYLRRPDKACVDEGCPHYEAK